MMFQFRLNHMAIEFYGIDWIEGKKTDRAMDIVIHKAAVTAEITYL